MRYQVEFKYKQVGPNDEPIRTRGTQVKLNVEGSSVGLYTATSVGDDIRGRGESVKDAILDWLSNCPMT